MTGITVMTREDLDDWVDRQRVRENYFFLVPWLSTILSLVVQNPRVSC